MPQMVHRKVIAFESDTVGGTPTGSDRDARAPQSYCIVTA